MKAVKRIIIFMLAILITLSSFHIAFAESEIDIDIVFNDYTNNLGYIYFDYNPVIYAEIINSSTERISVDVEAEVYEGNELLSEKSYQLEIPKDSSEVLSVDTEVEKFGIFTLRLTVGETYIEQEFSIANRPRDGVKNSYFALSDHTASLGHGADEAERKTEIFSRAGFGSLRYSYLWYDLEHPENKFSLPERYTTIKDTLQNNNMDSLICLNGTCRYVEEDFPTSEINLDKWIEYVKYVVSESKDFTYHYEVRNEPNINGGTPESYFNLLKKTYEAVKSENDSAKVCAFAVASVGSNEGYEYSSIKWIEEVLKLIKNDGGKYMDAVSIHTYNSVAPETPTSELVNERTWLINETRGLLDDYGFGDIPIIVSEMGWYSHDHISELNQAEYMIRYATLYYNKVERIYWYGSQEKQTDNAKEDKLGVIKTWDSATGEANPYGAKPAFLALSNYNAFMTDADLLERNETEGVYNYKFRDRFGKTVYLAWTTESTSAEVTVNGDGKYLTVYDMYGNKISEVQNAGTKKIAVSGSPVYIRLTDVAEDLSKNKVNIAVDANTGTVTVSGISPYGNCTAGVSVIKSGTDNVLYANQIQTESDGDYGFSFISNGKGGTYDVKIGFYNSVLMQTGEFEIDIYIPELTAEVGGVKLTDIAQLSDGATIDISLSNISKVTSNRDTVLVIAEYKNEVLTNVKRCSIAKMAEEHKEQYVIEDSDSIDEIKIFYWDISDNKPITTFYNVTKGE